VQAIGDLERIGNMFLERPVLYYGDDALLLLVSRQRAELARYRLLLPPPDLVEALVDKSRFAELANELGLPVPRTLRSTDAACAADVLRRLTLPVVLKPACHIGWLHSAVVASVGGGRRKALQADTEAELETLLVGVREFSPAFVIQELIPGDEDQIYSFHAYVDARHRVLGHYIGRKIRTYPMHAGISTYLTLVHDDAVREAGLDATDRLGVVGPLKLDFKRDPRDGRLYLLEVNPRYSLWNHLGAACGVNLPLIAYRDLTGERAQPQREYRTDVRWLSFGDDMRAFVRDYRPAGALSVADWLRSFRGPKVYDVFAWRDPWPLVVSVARSIEARLRALRLRSAS